MKQRGSRLPLAIFEDQHLVRGGRLQVRALWPETTDQPQLILVGHQHRVMHGEGQTRAGVPRVIRQVVILRLVRRLGRHGRTGAGQATGQPDPAVQHCRMQLLHRNGEASPSCQPVCPAGAGEPLAVGVGEPPVVLR